ncbi:MAG: anaerobic ribonucleoside-triphosphate reductase activating protein [Clostridia bacterium]|nr:anaerobic ribonucleoside-triphosphate reductase activating protein [Clostridia bacterium]
MNFGEIKNCDIANGLGCRVSLFVSGCTHHCKGCFNAQTWDFNFGEKFTEKTENYILDLLKPSYIRGLSLLGGEPFEPENQKVLYPFLKKVKNLFPDKTVWCYSGYLFEEIVGEKKARCTTDISKEMLSLIDVLVDGRFIESQKDIRLKFRGSSNQRIIDVQNSLKDGKIVDFEIV